MIFQVKKDNKVMFWTEHDECIPSDKTISEMKKAGYKIKYKDGNDKCTSKKLNA